MTDLMRELEDTEPRMRVVGFRFLGETLWDWECPNCDYTGYDYGRPERCHDDARRHARQCWNQGPVTT